MIIVIAAAGELKINLDKECPKYEIHNIMNYLVQMFHSLTLRWMLLLGLRATPTPSLRGTYG